MLGGGPFAHIVSAFRHQTEHRLGTKSVDLRQVGSQQSLKCGTYVKSRLIAALCMPGVR
jgi:hypothetical protein